MSPAPTLSVALAAIAVVCVAAAVTMRIRRPGMPGSGALTVQLGGIALWTLANGLALLDLDIEVRSRLRDIGAIGPLFCATGLAWFIARFSGRHAWLTRAAVVSLCIADLAIALVFVTNAHGLLNPGMLPGHDPNVREYGPAYWTGILWVTLLLGIGTTTLLRHRRHVSVQQRHVTSILIAGTLTPWAMSFLRVRRIEFWNVDPVVVGMMAAAAACIYAALRGFGNDIESAARSVFVDNLSDGVVIIDADGTVAVMSERARHMLDVGTQEVVGRQLIGAVADARSWRECLTGSTSSAEVRGADGERLHIRTERLPLRDRRQRTIGTAILLRDVTTLHTDPLTGIGNRRCFHETAPEAVDAAIAAGAHVSVVAVDLDNLKHVNDTWGHQAGDRALGAAAIAMRDALRLGDRIMRLGGDEFVALLTSADPDQAVHVVERMRAHVDELHAGVTITAGIAAVDSGDQLLRALTHADQALYAAKRQGRNRIQVATPATS